MATERARARYTVEANTTRAQRNVRGLQRRFQDLGSSVTILQGPLSGVASRITALSVGLGRMGPALLGGGLAAVSFTAAIRASIREVSQLEKQQGRIAAVLKSTGNSAGLTAEEIDGMARALGRDTLTSQGAARDAAGILLTFQSIVGDNFRRTLTLSQDVAAVMGTDLRSAALQLGKALDDPATGLTALRRSGISFTTSQQDTIKALFETGQVAEAQELILKRLEEQVGGAGVGEATGLVGAVDSLAESWTTLLQEVGRTSELTTATNALRDLVDTVTLSIQPDKGSLASLLAEQESVQRLLAAAYEVPENAPGLPDIHGQRAQELRDLENRSANLQSLIEDQYELRRAELEANKARKQKAEESAKARAEENAAAKELEEYDKRLLKLRRSLGSTTFAQEEHAAAVKDLKRAYQEGKIEAAEFVELNRALLDRRPERQDLVGEAITGGRLALDLPGREKARIEIPERKTEIEQLKKQTEILQRIEKGFFISTPQAVTA